MLIAGAAFANLVDYAAQAADGRETGGILLGHDPGLTARPLVRHVGDAGPNAVRRRSTFVRDQAHAQTLAERQHCVDRSVWIGDWHTHLIALPEPSDRDLTSYRRLLDDPDLSFARFLAVIVLAGPDDDWSRPSLHAWSFTGSVLRALPVAVAAQPDPPP